MDGNAQRIICLSNVYDQQYHQLRGEAIARCLSSPKRRDLFRCLELATDRELVVLSSPPKASERRTGAWIASVETRFSTHRQLFSANWDFPKLRVPLSWFFYALHVLRNVRNGDLILIDNFEFIYILAALLLIPFRKVRFLIDLEDGKHLIDSGLDRVLSGCAEAIGKRLVTAGLLAHPSLKERLSPVVPTLLIPGFINPSAEPKAGLNQGDVVQFLYSGSLDRTRGVDLLIECLPLLPKEGWHLHITGAGELDVLRLLESNPNASKVTFHGTLPAQTYSELIQKCHVGLNCQRVSDPISEVTFPSKIFSYLSAGLLVLSSRASSVPEICGAACEYYEQETAENLAQGIANVIGNYSLLAGKGKALSDSFSIEATAKRLRDFLVQANLL